MSIIEKMISFIKRLFNKEEIKQIEEPKGADDRDEKREKFLNSLKVEPDTIKKKEAKRKVETLICIGDGLGIQGRISS